MVQYTEIVHLETEDFLAYDDNWQIRYFRPPRAFHLGLCLELRQVLECDTAKSPALPIHIQLLTTLGFSTTRSFQMGAGRPIGTVPVDPELRHATCGM